MEPKAEKAQMRARIFRLRNMVNSTNAKYKRLKKSPCFKHLSEESKSQMESLFKTTSILQRQIENFVEIS